MPSSEKILMSVRPRRRVAVVAAFCTLVAAVAFTVAPERSGAVSGSVTFSTSGTWTVPAGVDTIQVTLLGGGGGSGGTNASTFGSAEGGSGAKVTVSMTVAPGDAFSIEVGTPGGNGSGKDNVGAGATVGYGRGGSGNTGSTAGGAGAGGGTASRLYSSTLGTTIAVAGGGGGGGGAGITGYGGTGGNGAENGEGGGGGGAGSAGGVGTGTTDGGNGGNAASSSGGGGGGGGGAGWNGGGGGGGGKAGGGGGGGGAGGANYVNSTFAGRALPDSTGWNPRTRGQVDITYSGSYTTHTSVTATPSDAVTGQSVTLRATVGADGTATIPGGTVQFTINGEPFGGPRGVPADGIVEVSTTNLPAGVSTVRAVFQPSDPDDFEASNGETAVTVGKGATSMTLTDTAGTTAYGAVATFRARVTAGAPAVGVPDGDVQFFADGSTLGGPVTLDASGEAVLDTTALSVGSSEITATFLGSARWNTSDAGPLTHVVDAAPAQVALSTVKNPTVIGESIAITATVRGTGTSAVPTGTVRFSADGVTLGTIALDPTGAAVLSGAGLGVGAHEITSVYSGDSGFAGATATPITQRVDKGDVTVVVASPSTPSGPDDPITLNVAVNVLAPAAGTPTGTIQFIADGHPLGSPVPVSGGGASIDVAGLPVGIHQIAATYSGDRNFNGATGAPIGFDIAPIVAHVTVASSVNPSVTGQSVRFAAVVTGPGARVPSGAVTFLIDGVETDVVNLGPTGRAVLDVDNLSVGAHTVVARYAGDGVFTGATSAPLAQTVARGQAAVVVAPPTGPTLVGDIVTVTAHVTAVSPAVGVPSGPVQLLVDGEAHGDPVPSVGGTIVAQLDDLTVGSHQITAAYAADGAFAAATSRPVTFRVDARVAAVGLDASITGGTTGDPVRLTARVSPASGSEPAPTGTLSFFLDGAALGDPVTLGPDGTASVVVDALAAGVTTLTATYSGDAAYREATSDPIHVGITDPVPPVEPKSPLDGLVINNNLTGFDKAAPDSWSSTGSAEQHPASPAPSASQSASPLPATGFAAVRLAILGSLLLLTGAALVLVRRRTLAD